MAGWCWATRRISRALIAPSSRSAGPMRRYTATSARAPKGCSRVTTRRRPGVTSRPTAIACRPKRNGSMPAAPALLRRTRSAPIPSNWANTRGLPTTPARRPSRWPARSRTPGACTTCTGTSRSGAMTCTTRSTIGTVRKTTRRVPRTARSTCCAAAPGTRGHPAAERRPASARIPDSRTPVSPATRSASAACGGPT